MKKDEFYYESLCNTNKIHVIKWVPEGTPLCVARIVHGMADILGWIKKEIPNQKERKL